jgi:hypothetical protein
MESRLHPFYGLHAEIKSAYDSVKYMLTQKSLPTWLLRQSNGLYVPVFSTLRSRVLLYELHDAPTACITHPGITRLLAAVTRTFWWPNMKRVLQHYVRNCVIC